MTNGMISISPSSTFLTYVAIFQFHLYMVFIFRSWLGMQELVQHKTDKQVDVTVWVSTVSFTGSLPQILWSLQTQECLCYNDLVCQCNLSFGQSFIPIVKPFLIHWSWLQYGSTRLNLNWTCVTGRKRMLTPPRLWFVQWFVFVYSLNCISCMTYETYYCSLFMPFYISFFNSFAY
jgi:hypothetical protein